MAQTPPTPPEQRSFKDDAAAARLDSARPDRRDLETGVQSPEPGDADAGADLERVQDR